MFKIVLKKAFHSKSLVEDRASYKTIITVFRKTDRTIFNGNRYMEQNFIIIPLYSPVSRAYGDEPVPKFTQLNRWNSLWTRTLSDVTALTFPILLDGLKPQFFPDGEKIFNCLLPCGSIVRAHVCYDCRNFYVHSSNLLEDWLLRKVLGLAPKELLTYDKLREAGVDSLKIIKEQECYRMATAEWNAYERFVEGYYVS